MTKYFPDIPDNDDTTCSRSTAVATAVVWDTKISTTTKVLIEFIRFGPSTRVHPESWIGQSDGFDEYSEYVPDIINFSMYTAVSSI